MTFPSQGALATLGIPFVDVLRILVAILLLGNVEFVDGEGLELDVKGNNGRYHLYSKLSLKAQLCSPKITKIKLLPIVFKTSIESYNI